MKYPVREGITSARHSAVHLESRDSYTPDDPEFARWRAGYRYHGDASNLQDWWWPWRASAWFGRFLDQDSWAAAEAFSCFSPSENSRVGSARMSRPTSLL